MSRDEIISMAIEAGWSVPDDSTIRIAQLVAAKEREECAKLCETNADRWPGTSKVYAAMECAAAIRARGTP